MNCPNCIDKTLRSRLTRQGVGIDSCDRCGGAWLDKGEIFHFTKKPAALSRALRRAMQHERPTDRLSPKTNQPMTEVPLLGDDLVIDICKWTNGIWLNGGELNTMTVDGVLRKCYVYHVRVFFSFALLLGGIIAALHYQGY